MAIYDVETEQVPDDIVGKKTFRVVSIGVWYMNPSDRNKWCYQSFFDDDMNIDDELTTKDTNGNVVIHSLWREKKTSFRAPFKSNKKKSNMDKLIRQVTTIDIEHVQTKAEMQKRIRKARNNDGEMNPTEFISDMAGVSNEGDDDDDDYDSDAEMGDDDDGRDVQRGFKISKKWEKTSAILGKIDERYWKKYGDGSALSKFFEFFIRGEEFANYTFLGDKHSNFLNIFIIFFS